MSIIGLLWLVLIGFGLYLVICGGVPVTAFIVTGILLAMFAPK